MPRMAFRGPFLLIFALDQQLATLLAKTMADAPLRPVEFAVYSALRLEQPTTPSELAGVLGQRPTTMSSQLARMSERGHLERTPNPRDGRSSLISLTPEGLAATEACFDGFGRAIAAYRKHFDGDEDATLRCLEQMSAALERALADPEAP